MILEIAVAVLTVFMFLFAFTLLLLSAGKKESGLFSRRYSNSFPKLVLAFSLLAVALCFVYNGLLFNSAPNGKRLLFLTFVQEVWYGNFIAALVVAVVLSVATVALSRWAENRTKALCKSLPDEEGRSLASRASNLSGGARFLSASAVYTVLIFFAKLAVRIGMAYYTRKIDLSELIVGYIIQTASGIIIFALPSIFASLALEMETKNLEMRAKETKDAGRGV